MADPNLDPAVTVCFNVIVGDWDLGAFSSCEGLGLEVTVEQREEGGNHDFIYQFPGRMKYTNIKLTRAIVDGNAELAYWVAMMATQQGPKKRATAQISAMTSNFMPVVTYNLIGVIPVKWTGPQLNVDSPKVAMETLELAHHGFAPGMMKAPPKRKPQ